MHIPSREYSGETAYTQNDVVRLADGEALVLKPDGKGGVDLLARVKIEEWGRLGKLGK